jgi:hypothetical protein
MKDKVNEKTDSPLKVSHVSTERRRKAREIAEENEKLKAQNEALFNVIRILGLKSA